VEFWASAASVASACDSISRADHAAYAANMPGRAARPPPVHAQRPRPRKGLNESAKRRRLIGEFKNTRVRARESLSIKSHGRWLANCDSLRGRAANRLDYVTLTPGAAALAVATNTLWVPFRPTASGLKF